MKRLSEMTIEDFEVLLTLGLPSMILLPESVKDGLDPKFSALLDLRMLTLYALPSLNGKGIAAFWILYMEFLAGTLRPGSAIVVPSSGNTVLSMALLKHLFGIARVIAVIEKSTPPLKQDQIWKAGAELMYPDPARNETAIQAGKRIAEENGWQFINQYSHPGSWTGHYKGTAPHIIRETDGEVAVICAAMGTTSTVYGAERYCLDNAPKVDVLGVASMPGKEQKVDGSRNEEGLLEIEFPYKTLRTPLVANTSKRGACEMSLRMVRGFVPVGLTGGLAVAGSLRHYEQKWKDGSLEEVLKGRKKLLIAYVGMDMHVTYDYQEILQGKA